MTVKDIEEGSDQNVEKESDQDIKGGSHPNDEEGDDWDNEGAAIITMRKAST